MITPARVIFIKQIVIVIIAITCQIRQLHGIQTNNIRRDDDRVDVRELFARKGTTSRWREAFRSLHDINDLKLQITGDNSISNNERVAINNGLDEVRNKILNGLQNDDKYGRAIAAGLAGNEWKTLQNEHINGVRDGIELGLLIRGSKACGDALGSRVAETADSLIGGLWDSIMSFFSGMWNTVYQDCFHSGERPFIPDHVKGWQDLVKTTFDDLERLLRDGLKDSLRGHDMTLRTPGSVDTKSNQQEAEISLNGWGILINGYIRQFEYVISCIEHNVIYYDGELSVEFYANDLKQRLIEVNQLLTQGTTLKELDRFLESNKALIPALKKNILNLFARLLELIEVKKAATRQTNRPSNSMSRESRDSDDGGFPHPMMR